MFEWLAKRLFPNPEPEDDTNPYEALGLYRNGIIWALGFTVRDDPMIVSPPGPDDDLFATYRAFVDRTRLRLQTVEDDLPFEWWRRSMDGALRLTTGDLGGADAILDNLPPEPIVLDHGAGRGMLVPAGTILYSLPLPKVRPDWQDMIAASDGEREVRDWLDAHRERLVWHEIDGLWKLSD